MNRFKSMLAYMIAINTPLENSPIAHSNGGSQSPAHFEPAGQGTQHDLSHFEHPAVLS